MLTRCLAHTWQLKCWHLDGLPLRHVALGSDAHCTVALAAGQQMPAGDLAHTQQPHSWHRCCHSSMHNTDPGHALHWLLASLQNMHPTQHSASEQAWLTDQQSTTWASSNSNECTLPTHADRASYANTSALYRG